MAELSFGDSEIQFCGDLGAGAVHHIRPIVNLLLEVTVPLARSVEQ